MQETDFEREARLRGLASRLLFTLAKEGSRFSLYRETDVPDSVRYDDLTLDEVEETLTTWKLQGRTAADGVGDGYNCVGCGCTASD